MKITKIAGTLIVVATLAGCATSSVVVGTVRPPIAVSAVKIYLAPPKKYEQVALLESSSKSSWAFSDQGKMDAVVLNLKTEAAKMGANGILLSSTGNQVTPGMVMVPIYGGGMLAMPANAEHKAGSGIAIFVTEE